MNQIKHYPPWFAAIHSKNEEAKKKGLSYGQLEALDWEKKGRPRRPILKSPEDEEITVYPTVAQANHAISERALQNRERHEENAKKYGASQAVIREFRKKTGLSAARFSDLVGVSIDTIYAWEKGYFPAHWDKLVAAIPELAEYVPEGKEDG